MAAVGGVNKFTLPHRPQPVGTHQGAYPVSAHGHALLFQRSTQPAATVDAAAGSKSGFQLNAGRARHGRAAAAHARGVIAGLAYLEYPVRLAHGHGLLLQFLDKPVAHLSSRAKKAEVGSTGQRNMI